MSQYFIHLSSYDRRAGALARRAAAALDVLQPAVRRVAIAGPGYRGWLVDSHAHEPAASLARSADGNFDLAVAGTWFLSDAPAADAQALVERFGRNGIAATAAKLEGAFAIAIYDRRRRALSVVTDVAGTLHVFARRHADGWMISTSSAWLAAMGAATYDPVGVHEFVATGIVYEDRTLWRDVRKLGQARIATFSTDGASSEERYWSFANLLPEREDLATSAERVATALAASARKIAARFPRVLCDITGGYDSRATVAGFMIAGVPFSGTVSGPPDHPDVRISNAIAARFAIEHRRAAPELSFERAEFEDAASLTDGEYDAVEYARIAAIHREHAKRYDISINGSFGELARGYWWELLWPTLGERRTLDEIRLARLRFAAARYDPAIFADGARFDFISHMVRVIARVNEPLRGMPNTTLMDHAYFAMRMQRWQGRIASSTARIWPTLSPFAFRSVLEPMLEARASSRFRSLLVRTLLERYVPALARVPLEAGHPAQPATATNLHRFWSLVPHYAGRIGAKIGTGGRATQARGDAMHYASLHDLEPLLASPIFAPDALQRLLASGRADGQYARLLTLGLTSNKVAAACAAAEAIAEESAAPRARAQNESGPLPARSLVAI